MGLNELIIQTDGSFEMKGMLPADIEDTSRNFASSLKAFISKLHLLRKTYSEFLKDDGKLIGQERFLLIEQIDIALNELIFLRLRAEGKSDCSALHMRYNFRLRVYASASRWKGQGMLGIYRKMKIKQFNLWISRILHERLVSIVQFCSQALADGIIDSRERIILNRSLDRLIFGMLLARDHIEHAQLQ